MLVSECFRQYLKSLYLNEYPCHSKPKRPESSFSDGEHPMYEIEQLLELIRDKKSPWHETVNWTRNGDMIRESYIKDSNSIDLDFIEKYFTSLRFNDLQIRIIDKNLTNFVNLNELILTSNQIEECDSSNLPVSLNILDLTGNYLSDIKSLKKRPLVNLNHLGLAYNWIGNISNCFEQANWPALTSLDLSCNQFTHIVDLMQSLLGLNKLKCLMLHGNPVVALPGYRGFIINSFDENNIDLFALDDKIVSRDERIQSQDFRLYGDLINKEAAIKIEFKHIKNLNAKEQPEIDEQAPEVMITKYLIKVLSIDENYIDSKSDYSEHKLHSMSFKNQIWKKNHCYKLKYVETEESDPLDVANLNEKGQINFKIKSKNLKSFRDFLLDGTDIELVERKKFYRTKEAKPSDSAVSTNNNKDSKKSDAKAGPPKPDAKQEAAKKKAEKNAKGKKKTIAEALESFSLDRTEEKCLARFELDLSPLLDGQTREVKKEFSVRIKLDVDGPKGLVDKSLASIKEQQEKAKKEKATGKKSASQANKIEMNEEAPPVELDVKYEIVGFHDLKELKNYFK